MYIRLYRVYTWHQSVATNNGANYLSGSIKNVNTFVQQKEGIWHLLYSPVHIKQLSTWTIVRLPFSAQRQGHRSPRSSLSSSLEGQDIMLFISVLARALHAGHFTWTPTEPWVFISVYLARGVKINTCAYCWEAVGLSRWSFNLHFVTSWAIKEVRWTYLLSSFFPFSLAVFLANKANTLSDEMRRGSGLVLNAWVDVSLLYDVLFPLYYNLTDDAETDTWDVNWLFFNAVNGIECSINFFVIICVFSKPSARSDTYDIRVISWCWLFIIPCLWDTVYRHIWILFYLRAKTRRKPHVLD